MRKVLVIASREYNAAVRTKSFLISLLVLPIIMGGSVLVQLLVKDQVDTDSKRFAVVDRTPGARLAAAIKSAAQARNKTEIFDPASGRQVLPRFLIERVQPGDGNEQARLEQRYELSERVRRGELFGFLEIGSGAYEYGPVEPMAGGERPGQQAADRADGAAAGQEAVDRLLSAQQGAGDDRVMRYQSNSPTYDAFRHWVAPIINSTVKSARYQEAELPVAVVQAVQRDVPLVTKGLSERDEKTGRIEEAQDENEIASIMVPGGLAILMFMLTLVGATPLMQGVVEEKMQRIAEVLLGSVRPFELMMGKLLGLVGISITLAAVYLGGAYWAAVHYGLDHFISPYVVAWFMVYLVLGVLMYGSLFIAVGAACTDLRETQNMLWPVMIIVMLPMFVWVNVVREPNSSFSTIASLVPSATPMLMLVRIAVPPGIAWWQPLAGAAGVVLATLACVYAAGRIFRVGLLMQGKGASPRDLIRWVIRG